MTRFNPNIHKRRSIRLMNYDYSNNGLYFITICTQNRECLFGEIADLQMLANPAGEMIMHSWQNLSDRFTNIDLGAFVVMPNHLHGIISVTQMHTGITPTIGDIVCAFKSLTTLEYSRRVIDNQWPPFDRRLWQRNYYERIVRNEKEYGRIEEYIMNNPKNWKGDDNYDG